ncbi:MAG TPA: hypothetical protein V6D46_08120 [Coleofasciculaceae cyanobacterium]
MGLAGNRFHYSQDHAGSGRIDRGPIARSRDGGRSTGRPAH